MIWLVGWLIWFYDISTFVAYSMLNPFSCKQTVLFQTIQLSMSTQFVKTFLFQTIQFIQAVIYNNSV